MKACRPTSTPGLAIESRYFTNLVMSPEAKNMIRSLFFGMQEANKLASRPAGVPPQKYTKVGMLGAGMMGAGIAMCTAQAGIEVVLLDTTQEAAEKGKAYAAKWGKQVAKGRMTQEAVDALLARIKPTADYADLKGCELVIEAVFEKREIKADVTKKTEAVIGSDAIFASNTSTLPITGLAEASAASGQFHRPAFLLAGGEDAAGRDHRRQGDQRRDAGARDGLRARHRQDADRGQ
jgi:3-hydroxyacyl-CoA dehydrogenase/enoyl-CoA hydratase/3-hydroxybutyryl-CoA epimerase